MTMMSAPGRRQGQQAAGLWAVVQLPHGTGKPGSTGPIRSSAASAPEAVRDILMSIDLGHLKR